MATTTNLALPYPASTDLVSQGYLQIQNLATGIDGYFGTWTGWSHGTAGVSMTNATGATIAGHYRLIGKNYWLTFSITAGTATAAGTVSVVLPTAIPLTIASYAIPVRAQLAAGVSTSARLETGTRTITVWGSAAGANFAASASIISVLDRKSTRLNSSHT